MGEYDAWGWFGASFGAPIETIWPHKPAPVGRRCGACSEPIVEGQDGYILPLAGSGPSREPTYPTDVPYHRTCFESALGLQRVDQKAGGAA